MDPAPADLRAAADAMRRAASFVTLAFEDVSPRGGDETWQGPAPDAFRDGARRIGGRIGDVAGGLRAVATRLEVRAAQLQAELRAVEEAVEEARRRRALCADQVGRSGGRRPGGAWACPPDPIPWPPEPTPPPAWIDGLGLLVEPSQRGGG